MHEVDNFKKEDNGLFPVHIKIDNRGFIFVNLEATEEPTIAWESQFSGSDTRDRLSQFNLDEYYYDHSWKIDGAYNWKASLDNYNEVIDSCLPTDPLLLLLIRSPLSSAIIAKLHIHSSWRTAISRDTVSRLIVVKFYTLSRINPGKVRIHTHRAA